MNIRAKVFGGEPKDSESPLVQAKKPKGAKPDTLNSIPVSREENRRGNTRDEDRHRLPNETVRVTHAGKSRDAQLVNLSGGGAMIECDFQPMLWDRVDLHLGENGTVECAVRWIKDRRVGLEFAHETRLDCGATEQAALLREVIGRSFPDVEFEGPVEAASSAPADEQRNVRRHPLIWSATLHHDYQSDPVRIRNISPTGAMIQTGALLRVGAEPLLDLGDAGSLFATVAWVVGDSAGLRFKQQFDLAELARSKPEVAPARWERPAYLERGAAPDSPWDEQWERMSLGQLRDELEGYLKR